MILFDMLHRGDLGRFDGRFDQVSFAGLFDIDLTIDERLITRVGRNPRPAILMGG